MDCGFALLMWAVGVRSSGPDTYAVRRRAGRCHCKLYALSMSLWYDICIHTAYTEIGLKSTKVITSFYSVVCMPMAKKDQMQWVMMKG